MTTTITVKTHAWEVDVTPSDTGTTVRVPAESEQTFHVHSSADLLIHEVQVSTDLSGGNGPPPHG